MQLIAIDPGDVVSALVQYDTETGLVPRFMLDRNELVRDHVISQSWMCHGFVVEMVASYGMSVGQTIFDTCLWAGRFVEAWEGDGVRHPDAHGQLIYRRDVKLHLCGSSRAKDTNIRQAILDRYGGDRRAACGTKKAPGPLYGFKKDLWAALAVAITAAETLWMTPEQPYRRGDEEDGSEHGSGATVTMLRG